MQRLTVQCEGEWSIDPDPQGEFVDADDALQLIEEMRRVLKIVAATLPHIGGLDLSVQSLLREIKSVIPE